MYTFRNYIKHSDLADILIVLDSCNVFYPNEVELAIKELEEDGLTNRLTSNTLFLISEYKGEIAGYTCYEKADLTKDSYQLHWIAVHKDHRHAGVGSMLLKQAEAHVASLGGKQMYIETSSRDEYLKTRQFYLRNGYYIIGYFSDFYDINDAKVIFMKKL
jgi:GNAT superfamily N-acetyltransferase